MSKNKYNIDISSDIGWGFSRFDAKRGLANAPEEECHVRLSSFGGSLAEGLDIRKQFADHKNVIVHIVGMTASSATVLAMGAKKIKMSRGASLLIHNCSLWWDAWGRKNKEEVEEEIEKLKAIHGDLETLDAVMADIYAKRTGKSVEEVKELMTANRWIKAEEALEFGLIDEIEEDLVISKKETASALDNIAALGLPDIESEQTNSESFLKGAQEFKATIKNVFEEIVAELFKPKQNQNETIMDKTTHEALFNALGVEEIKATEQGEVTLNAQQLQAINDKLKKEEQAAKENAELLAKEKQENEELKKQLKALEDADGEEEGKEPKPEANEELSIAAIAKLFN